MMQVFSNINWCIWRLLKSRLLQNLMPEMASYFNDASAALFLAFFLDQTMKEVLEVEVS